MKKQLEQAHTPAKTTTNTGGKDGKALLPPAYDVAAPSLVSIQRKKKEDDDLKKKKPLQRKAKEEDLKKKKPVQRKKKEDDLKKKKPLQRKVQPGTSSLPIDAHDSPLEKEADAVAEQIVRRMSASSDEKSTPLTTSGISRSAAGSASGGLYAPAHVASALETTKGQGQSLPDPLRTEMEGVIGADLSGMRIHTDAKAAELSEAVNAQAFTYGGDVYFNAGKYQPGTVEGRRLLGHEVGHVGQAEGKKTQTIVKRTEGSQEKDKNHTEDTNIILDRLKNNCGQLSNFPSFLESYIQDTIKFQYKMRDLLSVFNENYRLAFDNFERVITSAKLEAKNEQEWIDIISGILIGTTIGMMLPEGGSFPSRVSIGIIGESIESGLSSSLTPEISGINIKNDEYSPELINSKVWRKLSQIYQFSNSVLDLRLVTGISFQLRDSEWLIGQYELLKVGHSEFNKKSLFAFYSDRNKEFDHFKVIQKYFELKNLTIKKGLKALEKLPPISASEIEQIIWVLWISSISEENSNWLDLQAIENYLHGKIGILGEGKLLNVNFGTDIFSITTKEDELEAIAAAKAKREEYIFKFKKSMGPNMVK